MTGAAIRSTDGMIAVLRQVICVAGLGLALAACTIVSKQEDQTIRARGTADFDAERFVAEIWTRRVLPVLRERALPLNTLAAVADHDVAAAGRRFGRQAGEGSPWTFVVQGSGTVTRVDHASRRGTLELAVDGLPVERRLRVQMGPVISGTAIRDATPFLAFDNFPDQMAFAQVGRALNRNALAGLRAADLPKLGGRLQFTGVLQLMEDDDALLLTPLAFGPAPRNDG